MRRILPVCVLILFVAGVVSAQPIKDGGGGQKDKNDNKDVVKGEVKKVNAEKGLLTLNINGKDEEFKIPNTARITIAVSNGLIAIIGSTSPPSASICSNDIRAPLDAASPPTTTVTLGGAMSPATASTKGRNSAPTRSGAPGERLSIRANEGPRPSELTATSTAPSRRSA